MKLAHFAIFPAVFYVGQGRLVSRNIVKDGPTSGGTCSFNETWVQYDFPEGLYCDFNISVGFDGESHPKMKSSFPFGFIDLATWNTDYKEETLHCYTAKGYSIKQTEIGDFVKFSFRGHVIMLLPEDDVVVDEDAAEKISTPGLYWMQGGVHEFIAKKENCSYNETLAEWDCDPPVNITKSVGVFVDLCEAMTV